MCVEGEEVDGEEGGPRQRTPMFPSPQWWVLVGEKDTRLSPRGMSSVELLEVDPEEPTLFTVLLAGENTKNSTFLSQCPLGDRTSMKFPRRLSPLGSARFVSPLL